MRHSDESAEQHLVIRSAALRGLAEVLSDLGDDPAERMRRAGLPAEALWVDEVRLDLAAAGVMIETAAAELGRHDLGLRVARRQDISILGPLGLAVQNATTVREGIDLATRYLFLHSPALRIDMVPDPVGDPATAGLALGLAGGHLAPHSVDLGMAAMHRALVSVIGPAYRPIDARLPHPALAGPASYRRHFGAPVLFEQPRAMIRIETALLNHPLAGGSQQLRRAALAHLKLHSDSGDHPLAPQVLVALEGSLATNPLTTEGAARLFGVHPRTLQRKLAAAGTSVEKLLDQARRTRAEHLITTTTISLTEVAQRIGLSEQSALTRCARRWWQTTPSRFRAEHSR